MPEPLAGIDIGPVIEKSALGGQLLPKKAQGVDHAFARKSEGDIAAFFADAQRGQAESGGRDTAHYAVIGGAHVAAVLHHSGTGICLVPEKLKNRFFELLEKGIVSGRQVAGRRKLRCDRGDLGEPGGWQRSAGAKALRRSESPQAENAAKSRSNSRRDRFLGLNIVPSRHN